MLPPKKRWIISPRLPSEVDRTLSEYPTLLRQILFNRGYSTPETARRYLDAMIPPGTEPDNLTGVAEAVERIHSAIRNNDTIAIYGDYDADGVTATALLVNVLKQLGADVVGYIPNRFDEGYGLNFEALNNLYSQNVRLVITVDCGIRSIQEAEHALRIGLDLIISDHHQPSSDLPAAIAIINPKQPGDAYPEKDLAGVGLAYKLASVLMGTDSVMENYLDLVAIGTVADLAPLVGENRALVRAGITQIQQPIRQGVMALIGASGLKPNRLNATDIGFVLGPRLNAAGRLDSALAALELLLTQDVYKAANLAQKLDMQNRERQQITREIQTMAEQLAFAEKADSLLLIAVHPSFNPGVVGLAASKLTDLYYRPAIVAYQGEEYTRGSCRSIPEFHITQALDQCADLLEHHGGHAAAAGFTVNNANLPELVERLQLIAEQELSQLDLRPVLYADAEIPLSEHKPELLRYLDRMQPTGYGNRQAYFVSRNLKVTNYRLVGKEGAHLRLSVTDGWITYDGIAFQQGHWFEKVPTRIETLHSFEENEYNGIKTLQLNIRDIKPTETAEETVR